MVMYTILLLFFLLVILWIVYVAFDFDILSPSFVITGVFCFAVMFTLAEYNKLYYTIGFETVFIIITGIMTFAFVESLIKFLNQKKKKVFFDEKIYKYIEIQEWKIILLIIIDILILIATYREVVRVANFNSNTALGLINRFKMVNSFGDSEGRTAFNSIISQLSKISMAGAYICTFLVAYNRIFFGVRKKLILYVIPVVLWIPLPLIKANRLDVIQYVVAAVVYTYFLFMMKKGWRKKGYQKFIKRMIVFVPLFLMGFYLLKLVMQIGSEMTMVDYLFAYVGGSITNLEAYIQSPVSKSDIWGRECFYRIYNGLHSLGLYSENFTAHLEFRTIAKGIRLNTYTYFRRALQDFGYMGMYLVVALSSVFYNGLYYKTKQLAKKNKNFAIICYGLVFYPCVLFTTDFYIKNILTIGMLSTIFLFYVMYKFLTIKIVIKFRT